jgi:hypothetical protein
MILQLRSERGQVLEVGVDGQSGLPGASNRAGGLLPRANCNVERYCGTAPEEVWNITKARAEHELEVDATRVG